jgi:Family of unknown function (DUF6188)
MELGLQGQTVTDEQFGYSVSLHTSGGYEVQIEVGFSLCTAGERIDVTPAPESESSQLQALLQHTITAAVAEGSGALSMKFDNGVSLHVEPDEDFEAWTIAGPQGQKVVCEPGGEIAVWGAEDSDSSLSSGS